MCHLKLFRESGGQGQRHRSAAICQNKRFPSAPAADANLLAWLKMPRVLLQEGIDRTKRNSSPKEANFANHRLMLALSDN